MADDIDFKQAMRDVRPLKKESVHPRCAPRKHRDASSLRFRRQAAESFATDTSVAPRQAPRGGHSNEQGEHQVFFLRHGVQKKVLRELKKGVRYPVEYTLDLHGFTWAQANREIDRLFSQLPAARLSCLLIIPGKGLHSPEGARLKTFTIDYLKTLQSVRAFCSAQVRDGGTGALYVLVRT